MVFQPHTNYLAAKLEVKFDNNAVIDMIGNPHTGTGYSLPGHVMISLPTLPSMMEGRLREVRELSIVMEGKSEFWDDSGRYTPLRVYTTTLIIATPATPLLLPSHDPSQPHVSRIRLAAAFDLRLPGWLPPSHASEMTATAYGVLCHATLGWTEPSAKPSLSGGSSSSSSVTSSASVESVLPFRHAVTKPKAKSSLESFFTNHSLLPQTTEKSSCNWTPFDVRRHRLPAEDRLGGERNDRQYTLKPASDSNSPVECIVTVPEWVDVYGEERSLRVALKLRARREACLIPEEQNGAADDFSTSSLGVESGTAGRDGPRGERAPRSVPMQRDVGGSTKKGSDDPLTQMLELGMEVEEIERFSSTPSTSFSSSFPLPTEQPTQNSSQHQFISPRPPYADGGLLGREDRPFKGLRTQSRLLSDEGTQRSFFFPDGGLSLSEKWRKVNIVLPMPGEGAKGSDTRPQAEMDAPFLRIKHQLKIRVVCRGLGPDAQDTVVILTTPIRFGTSPSSYPSAVPRGPALPAYGQLFHENGDLKDCDPLPLYTTSSSDLISFSSATTPLNKASVGPTSSLPVPSTPAPPYKSLLRDNLAESQSSSSRSPSPSPSGSFTHLNTPAYSEEEPMDVDSSDENAGTSTSTRPGEGRTITGVATGRKAIEVPRLVETTA